MPGPSMVLDHSDRVLLFWAKLQNRTGAAYHPLLCHLIDVAAVARTMWDEVVPPATRGNLAAQLGLEEPEAGSWIAFWAGLHDLGKASPGFQGRDPAARTRLEAAGFRFDRAPDAPHGIVTAVTLREAVAGLGAPPTALLETVATAVGGHHGVFPRAGDRREAERAAGKATWRAARSALAKRLADALDLPASAAPSGTLDAGGATWLAGLVSVADWVGSDADRFPYLAVDPGDPPPVETHQYATEAHARARHALACLGWTAWPRAPEQRQFAELFPGLQPNPLQTATAEIAAQSTAPALVIVEAPMGEGKTEAALYLVDRWGAVDGRRGGYLALPSSPRVWG